MWELMRKRQLSRLLGYLRAYRTEHQATQAYFQSLKPNRICPAGIQTCLGQMTPLFLQFSPYGNRNIYLMPVPPLHFGSR